MLYISDIFNVDTKEHYDRIKSFTQAQMMYCVELRDFTTGEQRAMCMPKVVVAEEIIPFGVANDGNLFVVDSQFRDLLSYIDVEVVPISERDRAKCVDYTKFYSIDAYGLLHSRDFYFSYENTQVLGKKIYHITFDKDLSLELTKYAIKWRLV